MRMIGVTVTFLGLIQTVQAAPYRQTLICAERNINLANWSVTGHDLFGASGPAWSVRKERLAGGKQDGVDIITIDNGKLEMVIVPTRGMGIWSVTLGDVRLGWDSPVKEIVHPRYVNLDSRGGLGWLDGFGEWLCRCGLESNGLPGLDTIIDNTGAESTVNLTLHGKIAYLPAQEVELIVDDKPPHRITLRGRVAERMMFGPNLELKTSISTRPGTNTFRIADEIVNHAAGPAEFQLLYHTNFGPPLLEDGATFVGPVQSIAPRDARAAEGGLDAFARYQGPTQGYVEQVYFMKLYGDERNRTRIMLQNKEQDRAVSMGFNLDALPHMTIWKNTSATADGYVTGLEPGTNYPNARSIERKAGRVPKLDGGASFHAAIDVAIHVGAKRVSAAAQQIEAIRNDRATKIVEQP
jgi:galactose mutarotase-like enzyme